MNGEVPQFYCDNCGKPVSGSTQKYIMKIEMYASPDPPVITEEMLEGDLKDKMQELVNEMQNMDPQELEDQVFECYVFALCPACREEFHKGFIQQLGKKKLF